MNPTSDVFEQRVAALEGGAAALATASGSAAISYAVQNIALAGDHIVACKNLYGGTYNLFANTLKEQGITTTFVDPDNEEEIKAAIPDFFMPKPWGTRTAILLIWKLFLPLLTKQGFP